MSSRREEKLMRTTRRLKCACVYSILCVLTGNAATTIGAELDHGLFRAIRDRDDSRIERLLRQATPVNLRSPNGTTPLMVAAVHGSRDCVDMLLQHNADPNAANDRGVTALLWAVSDLAKVELLVNHGANVNARSALGNTPLLVATSISDATAVVEHLLAHGADLTARNVRGTSTLANACGAGNLAAIELLLSQADAAGSLDELIGDDGSSLLETAASLGTLEIVNLLCDHLAATHEGQLPDTGQAVNAALRAQHVDIACVLIERGANTDRRMGSVPSILFAAYNETGDPSALEALIKKGADIKARNDFDETALTWARRRGHPELIDTLVEVGALDEPDETPEIPQRAVNLHAGNRQQLFTDAVNKSIALLQRSSDVFLKERTSCVSCHHQSLPAVAIGWARDRGLPIDQASVTRMVRRYERQLGGNEVFINRCFQVDNPAPNPPRYLGWGSWGYSALGYPRSDVTDATAWYLAALQRPDGHWTSNMLRPPIGDGDFTATVLAMQVLQLYPISSRASEFRDRIERAARWLETTPARSPQERVYQLLGLGWAGRPPAELESLADRLRKDQRDDGGWSQLPNLASDAWATGQTLVALRIAGGVPESDPAYQRGLEFLMNTQFDDGSWFVQSRSWPFQEPFESGFPYGRDQWVSAGATAWSAMAITLAIEPSQTRLPALSVGNVDAEQVEYRNDAADSQPKSEATSSRRVSFIADVQPIIARSCLGCHSGDEPKGTLAMTELAPLLQGGETGVAAIVPGVSTESLMVLAAAGKSDELHMPPLDQRKKYPPLSAEELEMLKRWIDTGASWPDGLELKPAPY